MYFPRDSPADFNIYFTAVLWGSYITTSLFTFHLTRTVYVLYLKKNVIFNSHFMLENSLHFITFQAENSVAYNVYDIKYCVKIIRIVQ